MKMKFRFSRIDALRLLGVAFLVGLAFTNCALAQCDFKNSEKSDKPCNARDIQYEPCSSATRAAEQYVITLIRNGKAAKLAGTGLIRVAAKTCRPLPCVTLALFAPLACC